MSAIPETIVASQPQGSGWRHLVSRWTPSSATHAKMLNGSIVLLVGSVFVSLANFGYNIGVARLLGPSDFSHAAAAVTILMLVSALTLSFQLVCAKLVAKANSLERKAAVFQHLMKRAWAIGIALGAFMLVADSLLTAYLRLSTPWIIILLAVGLAIYVPLGVKRGGLQGTCRFKGLAWNMAAEAIVKFVGAIVLIEFGFGVLGAVVAISASVILAFCLPDSARRTSRPTARSTHSAPVGEARQAIVFFVGQVIISNIDILMVKHFFRPDQAGLYAAIALVGRLLYFGAWSVVSAMFPVSAESESDKTCQLFAGVSLTDGHGNVDCFRPDSGYLPDICFRGAVWFSLSHRCRRPEPAAEHECGGNRCLCNRGSPDHVRNVAAHREYRMAAIGGERTHHSRNHGFHSTLLEVIIVQQVLRILLLLAVAFPFVKAVGIRWRETT